MLQTQRLQIASGVSLDMVLLAAAHARETSNRIRQQDFRDAALENLLPDQPRSLSVAEFKVVGNLLAERTNHRVFLGHKGLFDDSTLEQLYDLKQGGLHDNQALDMSVAYLEVVKSLTLSLINDLRKPPAISTDAQISKLLLKNSEILDDVVSKISVNATLDISGHLDLLDKNIHQLFNINDKEFKSQGLKEQLDLMRRCVFATQLVQKLKMNIDQPVSSFRFDTGMSHYIGVDAKYQEAQDFHAGRPEALEQVVIPILATLGVEKMVEMGTADGKTSTAKYVTRLPNLKLIDAIEFDRDYFRVLKAFSDLENIHNQAQINPLNMSITDYKLDKPNSMDAFVATGAFTDVSPNQDLWVSILSNFRQNVLKSGGVVILEEEVCPFYKPGVIKEINRREIDISRVKALAIQRGHIIFDALLRNKIGLAEMELRALMSSILGLADYKGRLVDFKNVFEKAGYGDFQIVKVYPTLANEVVSLTPEKINIDSDGGWLEKGRKHTLIDYYNAIVNELLLVDTSIENPIASMHYDRAYDLLLDMYGKIQQYNDQPEREKLIKDRLGIEIINGQNMSLASNLEDDKTGGVYVLVAKVA